MNSYSHITLSPLKIDTELSAYLNFLRFFAALSVLLGHMDQDGLYMSWFPLAHLSHEAVVIFFVMSGLIIYSTTSTHRGPANYFAARTSRIYSVAFPAIIFSILSTCFAPEGGGGISSYRSLSLWDIVSCLLFLNESWQNPAALAMNIPYWSLCYEVWYYFIFGIYFFIHNRIKWLLLGLSACIAGPAVIALFPVWIIGALVAKGNRLGSNSWTHKQAITIFIGSIILISTINLLKIDVELRQYLHSHISGFWRLGGAQRLFTDYIVGISIALNILAFCRLNANFREFFSKHKGIFNYLAGFSFTLYLFHRPMTLILGYYFPNTEQSILYSITIALVLLLACCIISYGTERQLKWWRTMILAALPSK